MFYGWVLVGTTFVTMAIVVNTRTAFSLFFPSILDEFGWSRALTAATFTTGLLASNAFTPFMGVLMDRLGPRVVFPAGLVLMSLGLGLATLTRAPWQLHLTLGVLVAGASVFVSYMGHSLLLPNWFVRKRGLALGIAFSGVGVGSFILLPWLQGLIGRVGWRGACLTLVLLIVLLVLPLNVLLPRRRPEELGLLPDGDQAGGARRGPSGPGARRRPGVGRHRVDARRARSGPAASGGCSSDTSRVSSPGTRSRSTRRSTSSSWASRPSSPATRSASSG